MARRGWWLPRGPRKTSEARLRTSTKLVAELHRVLPPPPARPPPSISCLGRAARSGKDAADS